VKHILNKGNSTLLSGFQKTSGTQILMKHNIVLIEDHPVVASGLRNHIRPSRDSFLLAAVYEHPDQFMTASFDIPIHLVLLDLYIHETVFTQTIKNIKAKLPDTIVVIYTSEERPAVWQRAIDAGAAAVCPKSMPITELKKQIEELINNRFKTHESIITVRERSDLPSPEELEVIIYLQSGKNQEEIGHLMKRSQSSIEKIVAKLKTKHEAENIIQLLMLASRKGWI